MKRVLIVKDDGLIYAAVMPDEPQVCMSYVLGHCLLTDCSCHDLQKAYERMAASAKDSAILVSDQEKAQQRIIDSYLKRGDVPPFKYRGSLVIGIGEGIYPIPDLQWSVKEETIGVLSGASPFGSVSEFREVAILKESTPSNDQIIDDINGLVIYQGDEDSPSTEPQCPFCDAKDSLTMKKETASKIKGSGLLTATFDVWECRSCGESFFQHWNFNYIETNKA